MKSFVNLVALSTTMSTLVSSALGRAVFVRQNPATTDPNDDPFYRQPANISAYKPGDVIATRQVITVVPLTNSIQMKYRTTDGQGNSVSTVATVWIPPVPRPGPPAVLAYQYAEDAVQFDCAPSWAFVAGSGSKNANVSVLEGNLVVPPSLTKGYYVVNPDAEGPASSWLVGNMEGKAVLDAVRATINNFNLNKATTRVGLYGYSGGAHSTVWASTLRDSYAPELNIVGAAFGGTPVDPESAFNTLNKGPQAILAGAGLFGLAQGYPALQQDYQTGADGLTTAGKAVQKQFLGRNFCPNSGPANYSGKDWNTYFKAPLLTNPTLRSVTRRESLLSNVSSLVVPVPKFPRFEYHGNNDTTVPYGPELAYVQQQCAKGANIQFTTYNGLNHGDAAVMGLPVALKFLDLAFNNLTPKCPCGTACTVAP